MLEFVGLVFAGCLLLAVVCALFGSDKQSLRGQAVLRELLHVFRREDPTGGDQDRLAK